MLKDNVSKRILLDWIQLDIYFSSSSYFGDKVKLIIYFYYYFLINIIFYVCGLAISSKNKIKSINLSFLVSFLIEDDDDVYVKREIDLSES